MKRILIVDDEADTRLIFKILFRDKYEIIEAANGDEALRAINGKQIHLMLLDMVMPGVGGLEVLMTLKLTGASLPIIVLTGQTDIHLAGRALKLGASQYVTKPVDLAYLEREVRRTFPARRVRLQKGYSFQ